MKDMSLGVLVYGDNHLILRGPRPTPEEARRLAASFGLSFANLATPQPAAWTIATRVFRENLEWASVLPAETAPTSAIIELLSELAARGIRADATKETLCAA